MTSFVKHIAVFAAALIATTALGDKTDDAKPPKTDSKDAKDGKDAGGKKSKKNKGSKATPNPDSPDAPAAPPKIQIPVVKGHDSKGLFIPYFNEAGKRQMDFQIAVASRIDETLIRMTDMDVLTYNDAGQKDMKINLPTSVYNTESSAISTDYHVKISRDDFEIQGETMIFYTNTKQGALGGGVRMLIFNLKESTGRNDDDPGKPKAEAPKPQNEDAKMKPDGFKTPPSRSGVFDTKPDKLTPLRH